VFAENVSLLVTLLYACVKCSAHAMRLATAACGLTHPTVKALQACSSGHRQSCTNAQSIFCNFLKGRNPSKHAIVTHTKLHNLAAVPTNCSGVDALHALRSTGYAALAVPLLLSCTASTGFLRSRRYLVVA
jgi:hypothetical protein